MKPKYLIVLLILVLCFTLTGCFGGKKAADPVNEQSVPEVTDSSDESTNDDPAETPEIEVEDEVVIEIGDNQGVGGM